MAGLLYFAEGRRHIVEAADIKQWKLDYAFESAVECRECVGPGKKTGLLFLEPDRLKGKPTRPNYEKQEWAEMPEIEGRPKLWVGYWRDAKPGPDDLQRMEVVPGGAVRLADGNFWMIPDVRARDGEGWICNLPTYLKIDKNGEMVPGRPLDRYRGLWEMTAPLADMIEQMDKGEMLDISQSRKVWKAAVALIKANYVIDAPEMSLLEILASNESMSFVVQSSCQRRQLMDWIDSLKKTENQQESTGSTTYAGNGASPQATAQHGQTVEH